MHFATFSAVLGQAGLAMTATMVPADHGLEASNAAPAMTAAAPASVPKPFKATPTPPRPGAFNTSSSFLSPPAPTQPAKLLDPRQRSSGGWRANRDAAISRARKAGARGRAKGQDAGARGRAKGQDAGTRGRAKGREAAVAAADSNARRLHRRRPLLVTRGQMRGSRRWRRSKRAYERWRQPLWFRPVLRTGGPVDAGAGVAASRLPTSSKPIPLEQREAEPILVTRDWRDDVASAQSLASSYRGYGSSVASSYRGYGSSVASSARDVASSAAAEWREDDDDGSDGEYQSDGDDYATDDEQQYHASSITTEQKSQATLASSSQAAPLTTDPAPVVQANDSPEEPIVINIEAKCATIAILAFTLAFVRVV